MPRWGRGYGGPHGVGVRPRRIRRFLEPALLLLLHHQPSHGYALIDGLQQLGLETYPADASTVYRVLYDLEQHGMITSRQEAEQTAGPPRRVYELTEAGDAYLQLWIEDLRATDRLLRSFLEAYDAHVHQHQRDRTNEEEDEAHEDRLRHG